MSLVEPDKINCSRVIPKCALLIKISYKKLSNKIKGVLFKSQSQLFLELNLSFRKIIIDIKLFKLYQNFSIDFSQVFPQSCQENTLKILKLTYFL